MDVSIFGLLPLWWPSRYFATWWASSLRQRRLTIISTFPLPAALQAFVGPCGTIFGHAGFPATDPITAAAVGVASGLAATGIDQAVKQLKK